MIFFVSKIKLFKSSITALLPRGEFDRRGSELSKFVLPLLIAVERAGWWNVLESY